MTKIKLVKLLLCELTLYEHLERWPEWLRHSGVQLLYLSVPVWVTEYPKLVRTNHACAEGIHVHDLFWNLGFEW